MIIFPKKNYKSRRSSGLLYPRSNSLFSTSGSNNPASISDISITITPVSLGVSTTLISFTTLTPWVDQGYIQDFYYCNQTVDGVYFMLSRERNTNRVELWMYRPPVWDYRGNSSTYTAPNQSALMTDADYDIQISVAGSLIIPVYSASTTTRVRLATGNIRRLVSAFKPWDWTRIDDAVAAKRLPKFDRNAISSIYSILPTLQNDGISLGNYNHSTLGGASTSNWWDGVRSGQGGAYASSRSIYHSAEARAISERLNGITTNLATIEKSLRGSGEYAGTMPQYIVLDPATFKPYDSQKGNYKWSSTGTAANQSPVYLPRRYSYNVQTRTNYTFDSAHQYNCGQVAFEATKDPYYALLMQCNMFMSLACLNSFQVDVHLAEYDPVLRAQINTDSTIWNNLPYYILDSKQYRAVAWGTKEAVKTYHVTNQCPTVSFLHPASTFNTVITDDVNYNWAIQSAKIDTGNLSSSDRNTVLNGARKLLGIYGAFISGGSGNLDNPYKVGYSGLFTVYGLGALFYNTLSGRSEYLPHFTRILEGYCDATLNGAGGQRIMQVYPWSTKAGITNALLPATSGSANNAIVPAPFTTVAGMVSYWEANSDTWQNTTTANFNLGSSTLSVAQQFLMVLRSVKQLNDQGYWNILPSKVNDTMTIVNAQLAATTKTSGGFTNWGITYA